MEKVLTERDYYLGFSVFPEIGPRRFVLMRDYFGSAKKAWHTSQADLKRINLNSGIISRFIGFREKFSFPRFLSGLTDKNISFMTNADRDYPKMLKEIPDSPIVIYLRGNTDKLRKLSNSVAIVGTRMMTTYGKHATEKIVAGLVRKGVAIISGLAKGIDTVAHRTAIENNGCTIAVLGQGIDIIYPISNYDLYWQVVRRYGVIVSEYPPEFLPSKSSFPLRNRIISGLAKGVVVVEGKRTSGALITAKYALEQGREVFAVPGPINYPTSEGTAYLIKNGACVASSADDVLADLGQF